MSDLGAQPITHCHDLSLILAVAFSRTGDPASREFGDAKVIRKFGDVPDSFEHAVKLHCVYNEIARMRGHIPAQEREIDMLNRAEMPTASGEPLLARMRAKVDDLCRERDVLVTACGPLPAAQEDQTFLPCRPARNSASRKSTTAFGSSASCNMIWDTSTCSREPCNPSTTRSALGCHPCLRYDLLPMCVRAGH